MSNIYSLASFNAEAHSTVPFFKFFKDFTVFSRSVLVLPILEISFDNSYVEAINPSSVSLRVCNSFSVVMILSMFC
jgi:hypothetical protein